MCVLRMVCVPFLCSFQNMFYELGVSFFYICFVCFAHHFCIVSIPFYERVVCVFLHLLCVICVFCVWCVCRFCVCSTHFFVSLLCVFLHRWCVCLFDSRTVCAYCLHIPLHLLLNLLCVALHLFCVCVVCVSCVWFVYQFSMFFNTVL